MSLARISSLFATYLFTGPVALVDLFLAEDLVACRVGELTRHRVRILLVHLRLLLLQLLLMLTSDHLLDGGHRGRN